MSQAVQATAMSRAGGDGRLGVPYRLPIYLGCTLVAVCLACLSGKDMGIDTLDYHIYAGFSALHDRFSQDYFAAGPQSYFNPYAYVPFYVLLKARLPALFIGCVLAVVQSATLWLVFEIALCCCSSGNRRQRLTCAVSATIAAALNPVLIQQFGTSYSDVTTGELVLVGWLLLAQDIRAPRATAALMAGAFLGVAAALKLTNAVHAVAAVAILGALPARWSIRLRHCLLYGVGLMSAGLVVAAPWAYHLQRLFGNPLFPLANGLFRSPQFTTASLLSYRFIPADVVRWLWRPFAILAPDPLIQVEQRAPDVRYAVLLLLGGLLLLQWFRQRRGQISTLMVDAHYADEVSAGRVLGALGCGFLLDWTLWLTASGNGRYFLPMASVAAVLIVGLLFKLLRSRLRSGVLLALCACQLLLLCTGTDFRSDRASWSGPWLVAAVPKDLANTPNLYLTTGMQSNSYLAPFLGVRSGMIDFSGNYTLGLDGAGGVQVRKLLARYAGHWRTLQPGTVQNGAPAGGPLTPSQLNGSLQRLGLRLLTGDCVRIEVAGLSRHVWKTTPGKRTAKKASAVGGESLVSCRVGPRLRTDVNYVAGLRDASVVLNHLEDACPRLFQPRGLRTDGDGVLWRRIYIDTDQVAWVSHGEVQYADARNQVVHELGSERAWLRGPLPITCGRRPDGYYFARLQPTGVAIDQTSAGSG